MESFFLKAYLMKWKFLLSLNILLIFSYHKFNFKKIYDLGLKIIDELQEAYTFVCDMPFDDENERYIKFMAPLCYNSSLKVNMLLNYLFIAFINLK